jgi:hypothetical protein
MEKKSVQYSNSIDKPINITYVFENDKDKYFDTNKYIKTVNNFNDFKFFYKSSWNVYKNDKYWIPSLWIEMKNFFKINNPFWHHAEVKMFIARRKDDVVGRVAAFIDHEYCSITKKNIGFFGFFECINDFKIYSSLLKAAEKWLKFKGMNNIRGPINGRVDIGCGFLINQFNHPPSILDSYSPNYYSDFAKNFGLKKSRDFYNYYLDLTKPMPDSFKNLPKKNPIENIEIRRFNRFRTGQEMKWLLKFILKSFSNHWGYVPVSEDEIKNRFGIKEIRWFIDTKLFLISEVDNKPVGFIWATPDYNIIIKKINGKITPTNFLKYLYYKNKINFGKMNLIAINKKYREKGIASLLNYHIIIEMKKRGYKGLVIGPVDEKNNESKKIIQKMGAIKFKTFRVFEKSIK